MTKSQEESYQKKTENTKRFDAIGKKINKLLTATAGTFIPELAEALKDDWYPHLSYDIIKVNKDLQDEIRDKILSVYSYDWREGAPWANATIQNFFPDWLRNPTMQESNKENVKIASAAAAYQRKIGQQRAIFEREIEKLPEVPKELAPEPTGRYGILNEGQDQDEEESGPVERRRGGDRQAERKASIDTIRII
jgi:hypothetical protein